MVTKRLSTEELISREAHRLALIQFIETNKISPSDSLPPDTATQISEILKSHPQIFETAKNNILSEKSVYEEMLRKIGLNSFEIDALEGLDL